MKKTFRKAMISTICMLVVAIMSLTGVTYAWFSMGTNGKVEGITMSVSSADGGLQLSKDNGATWVSTLTLENATKSNMAPVSTVDGKAFFTAVVNADNPDQIKSAADTNKVNVWSTSFKAKNTGYQDIVVTLDGNVFSDTLDTDTRNSAQAARIAVFTGEGSSMTLAYIWGDGDSNSGIKAASDNAYFNYRGTSVDTSKVGDVTGLKTSASECTFEIPGMVIPETEESDTSIPAPVEQIVTVTVVVWLEGQDAQCINQNADSSFNVTLNFTSSVKTATQD